MDHCMEADRDTGNLTVNKREILQDYNLPQPEERVPNLSALMELGNPIGTHLLIQQRWVYKTSQAPLQLQPRGRALEKATDHGGVKEVRRVKVWNLLRGSGLGHSHFSGLPPPQSHH